jgi:hypothetical protein
MAFIYGELIRAQLHLAASDLTPVATGLLYLNTTSHQVKWYANAAWKTAVDLDTAQTLTNKTLVSAVVDAYVDINEETTPATPSAGAVRLYAKSDKYLYTKDSNGVEQQVGSGAGGGGEKTYVENSSAASAITGWFNVGDLDVARTTTASELPREFTTGTGIKITADANTQSVADYVYYDFTLDDVDLNKKLKIQWDQKQFGAYVAGNLAVVITTQADRTTAIATPDVTAIPAYDGLFTASFDTGSTATLSLVIRATTDMVTDTGIVISDVIVGPGQIVPARPWGFMGSFTPVFTGVTVTVVKAVYWRRDDHVKMDVEVLASADATANVAFQHSTSIPGVTLDTSKYGLRAPIGSATGNIGANAYTMTPKIDGGDVTFSLYNEAGSLNATLPAGGGGFDSGDRLSFSLEFAVSEWAGAPNYAGSNVTNWYSDDGSADVFGPLGSLVPNQAVGTGVNRDFVVSGYSITDDIQVDYNTGNGNWAPAENYWPYIRQSTKSYGVRAYWLNTTTIRVEFGDGGLLPNNATYAGNSTGSWADEFAIGARFRVRLNKSGVSVGFGIAGDDGSTGLTVKNTSGVLAVSASATQALGASPAKVTLNSTDIAVTLPTSGTYLVQGVVHVDPTSAAGEIRTKLYNSTDAADVSNSHRTYYMDATWTSVPVEVHAIISVSSSKTIQFFAWRDTGLAAANATSGAATIASLSYVRLN